MNRFPLRITLTSLVLVCLWVAMPAPGLHAGEPTIEEIVARANEAAYYSGRDGRADVHMTITDGKGGTRERKFTVLRLTTSDQDQKFYVYFQAPADVRKMAFLVWKNLAKDDDRWLWLPALNLAKRIAPGDKRTSFVGSDFVYEDISGRGTEEDIHELIETNDTHYILKNTPKDAAAVEFSHYKLWIDKLTFMPSKAEYYDANGKLYRLVEALTVENIQGFPTVTSSRVTDLNTGGNTVNQFSNIAYNIDLDERIFTERFLRRPPREVAP